MRTIVRAALVGLVALASMMLVAPARAEGTRCPTSGIHVPAGADLQSFLSAGSIGDAFCLEGATYRPRKPLLPRSGQALYGVPGATVIDGRGTVRALFDSCSLTGAIGSCGSSDASGVGLYDLVIDGAKVYDVRTGSGWFLDGVTATGSAAYGIVLRGTGTVVQNSVAEHNGRFGITASFTVGGRVENDVVAFNNSPSNPPGYSGATHFTNTLDLQVVGNSVHDNYGRGIWFDIDSEGALVRGNTVVGQLNYTYANTPYAVGDGIRIEISCGITVEGNTVTGNQGPQIAVDGSDRTLVSGNIANAPAGQPGIRVAPQDQRSSLPASPNCGDVPRTATDDTVTDNTITQLGHTAASDYDGVLQNKGSSDTSGTTFDANTYHVSNCAAKLWRWWTGSAAVKVNFATLQATYHQETDGHCATP